MASASSLPFCRNEVATFEEIGIRSNLCAFPSQNNVLSPTQNDVLSVGGAGQFPAQFPMAQTPAISLAFAAATDIGCVRSNNEDSFGYDAEQHLYVVCDGMGGTAGGEVASSMAVRVLVESFELQALEAGVDAVSLTIEERLFRSIYLVNRAVREAAAGSPEIHSMGTTLVCACLDGNRIVLGNVGDSRAYLLRNGVCQQITLDHSLLAEQVRNGVLAPGIAAASNLQSVITRAIGAANTVEPDFFEAELQSNDMIMLTSDGLTRYVEPEEIAAVAQASADLPSICQALIELAKRRGGVDNITCMMLRAVELLPEPLAGIDPASDQFSAA